MMSGDVSGLSSAGLEQLAALSKLSEGTSGENWLDSLLMPVGDGSGDMDLEFPWTLNDSSSDTSSINKRSGDDLYNSAPKRRRSTITLAAVRDALTKTDPPKPEPVKGDAKSTTLFAGKPMSKDDLVKLQGKLEKNRVMAREARKKKKEYVTSLEEKLKTYELKLISMQHRLLEAERQNVSLLAQLAHVTAAAQAQLAVASAGGQHMQLNPGLMPMMGGSSLSVAGNGNNGLSVRSNPSSEVSLSVPTGSPMMQDVSPATTPRGNPTGPTGFTL